MEESSCPYGLNGEDGIHDGVWGRADCALEGRKREREYQTWCKLLPAAAPRAQGDQIDWKEE